MPASRPPGDPVTVPASNASTRSLAYLISQYPALSMAFVVREVRELRRLGFRIQTASINPADRPSASLTDEEQEESRQTYYVKTDGAFGAAKAHLQTLLTNPIGYCRGLALLLRLGGLDLKQQFFGLMYFTEALMVGQWMRRGKTAHLHCHLGQQAATVGLFLRTVFQHGFSMTVHGPDEFHDVKGQFLARKVAAADFIICISSFARSQLVLLSPPIHWDKLIVVRLGVDPLLFSPPDQTPLNDDLEILCVGRLVPAKGQHILLAAVDRLIQQGCPLRLRLAGSGPDEESLRAHAAQLAQPSSVLFEGAVNQDRISTLYAAADIFCLPSFAEGVPVVLMEAMSMEIPCVTTNITGIPELIRDGIEGLLVPPSDLDALVEALAKLVDDAPLRRRLAASARERIIECYDLHKNVELLAACFTERVRL